jgi:hypothetical protein
MISELAELEPGYAQQLSPAQCAAAATSCCLKRQLARVDFKTLKPSPP